MNDAPRVTTAGKERGAYLMLVGVMALWASGVIVARSVHDVVPPIGFSFWRWIVAVAMLTPFALPALRRHWSVPRARPGRTLLLGLFMAGGSTLLVWSVQYTTASNVALISATQPIVTVMLAGAVLHERLRGLQKLGVAAALLGIVVMVARMDPAMITTLSFNPGDVLILLAIGFYACYAVYLHRWLPGLPALGMMYVTGIGGLLVLLPFYLVETWTVQAFTPTFPALAACVFMALVPTLLATTMWNISVGRVGPSRASVFINLLPIFGVVFAVLLLGESLHLYHLVGGILVCAGITLVVRG